MSPRKTESSRDDLLAAGSLCFRRQGFVATSVDDICVEAGVSKGAFFHHFASKESLAAACLEKWGQDMAAMDAAADFHAIEEPVERLLAGMDFYANVLSDPMGLKSCLAGTIAQEVFESNPTLREASHQCFVGGQSMFASLLQDAAVSRGVEVDAAALSRLWMGAIQGALILYKASQDPAVIKENLMHIRAYIGTQVGAKTAS